MEEEKQEPRTKVLKNGAIYDLDKGRIVANPGGGTGAITPEKSAQYRKEMAERKREAMVRGAARALEMKMPGEWAMPTALDVVEALGEAAMMKALNPDNSKQIDAARFILQEAGLAETQTKPSADVQHSGDLAEALRGILDHLRGGERDIIDGTVSDPADGAGGAVE